MRFLCLLLALLLAWPAAPARAEDDMAGRTRLAILPFQAADPALAPYGEGVMDSLISGLQGIPRFLLVDRGRVERVIREQRFQQSALADPATAVALGKVLDAHAVVAGAITRTPRGVRLAAMVTRQQDRARLTAFETEGPLAELFDLQDHLARQLAAILDVAPSPAQAARIERTLSSTRSLEAYRLYLEGRRLHLVGTLEAYAKAVEAFERAIKLDPTYALAHAALAEALIGQEALRPKAPHEAADDYRGLRAAQEALLLDPLLPQAHRAAGVALGLLGKPGREVALRRALALDPNDAEAWLALWAAVAPQEPRHEYRLRALALNPDLAKRPLPGGR